MSSASQFSLEEENFYKDIQDLVKKGSQNEKELSTFLQRYMDLLARADLDDETFIINFTKAALILEASTKVYGSKVDRLWVNLERVLEALKVNGKTQAKKKGENDEDVEDGDGEVPADDAEAHKKLPNPRRRRKLGDGLSSPDDFLEIDTISGLLGKNMNETDSNCDVKIKFLEEIPNLFIRNKSERKRIDVCLVQTADDRDDSRLRDWFVSEECMLVKEIYIAQTLMNSSNYEMLTDIAESHSMNVDDDLDSNSIYNGGNEFSGQLANGLDIDNVPDDSNNNVENVPGADWPHESLQQQIENEKFLSTEHRDKVVELNRSEEVEVGKFPNIIVRRLEDCLVDVNEAPFWNSTKFQDAIPNKKMRVKKTNKQMCELCVKKETHMKKEKRCHAFEKNKCLDSFFTPLTQPTVPKLTSALLPDEELYSAFNIETKLIEKLGKLEENKNIYEAFYVGESVEEENFLGFDGFENYLMRKQRVLDDYLMPDENQDGEADDDNDTVDVPEPLPDEEGLPLPTTENSLRLSTPLRDDVRVPSPDPVFEQSQIEDQNIIAEELKNQQEKKSQFERNKELGMKIAKWHSSLVHKIEVSRRRGALNMDMLAGKILSSYPESSIGEKPVISFQDLVRSKCKRDVPRYFFACLQLTNERNVDILKSNPAPLATDCMLIKKLRDTRVRHEFDEYTPNSGLPKRVSRSNSLSSVSPSKRKRSSDSVSSYESVYDSDGEKNPKKKKAVKPRSQSSSSQNGNQKKRILSAVDMTRKKRKVDNVSST